MKRKFIIPSLIFITQSLCVNAQVPGKESKVPFKAIDEEIYNVGDTLTMGIGSNTDGSFNYIYVPENIFMGTRKIIYSSAAHGIKFPIKHFSVVKNSGVTYGVFTYVPEKKYDVGIMNAMVEINLALESGELVSKSPSYLNKEQRQNAGTNTSDKYDKLKKLKDLYDSGVLTDEEYKIEKEKILNEPTK